VAKIHGMEVKGFTAWFVWLLVRLLAIVGFHNRFVVPINWAWEHIFLQEGR
jgi:NADH dehydrogenase